MKQLENKIISELKEHGASLIHFVDVSGLSVKQNRGLPNAILFGIRLSPSYMRKVMGTTDYVNTMIALNQMQQDEFYLTELKAGELADRIANLLVSEGYRAYSQSDNNLIVTGNWDEENSQTPLPHKTIAVLAGIGWIGKNNLLVTPEYGAALCIGTVLTDAPLHTARPSIAQNKCRTCKKCIEVCQTNALRGRAWMENTLREHIIDIRKCTTCMNCLLYCPYTRKYAKQHS